MNVNDDVDNGYILIKQEDIVDGIGCILAVAERN